MAKAKKIRPCVCLAIEYHAYINAVMKSDHNAIIVWGKMLLDTARRLRITGDDLGLLKRVPKQIEWAVQADEEKKQERKAERGEAA
jgi:hypothetical protein